MPRTTQETTAVSNATATAFADSLNLCQAALDAVEASQDLRKFLCHIPRLSSPSQNPAKQLQPAIVGWVRHMAGQGLDGLHDAVQAIVSGKKADKGLDTTIRESTRDKQERLDGSSSELGQDVSRRQEGGRLPQRKQIQIMDVPFPPDDETQRSILVLKVSNDFGLAARSVQG